MVTVIETVSADGRVLPPMFIYKASAHLMGWHAVVQKEEKATCAWSPKGWTDQELELEWVDQNFNRYSSSNIYVSSCHITTILLIASNLRS
jgi:hypothetical protein